MTTPDTSQLFASFAKNDSETCKPQFDTPDQGPFQNSCTGQYLYNGVLTIQRLLGDFILEQTGAMNAGYSVAEAAVSYTQFPAPAYESTGFYDSMQHIAPLLIVLGFLYPVAAMIGAIVREKELRQKELMKMMSVTESDIAWAWFVSYFTFYLVVALAVTGVSTALYENSDPFFLLVFWILTFTTTVIFAMVVSALFSKSTRGVLIGLLVFFMGVCITIGVKFQTADSGLLNFLSINPVAAFCFGIQVIGDLEDDAVGVTANTFRATDNQSGFTFANVVRMLIFDAVFWGLVSAYLNRIIRPDYGQAQPLWFPAQKIRDWLRSKGVDRKLRASCEPDDRHNTIPSEPVGEALRKQSEDGKNVLIKGLRKTFGGKIAVDSLDLVMYNGQITALLGQNGAGKTTTIGMLSGALVATAGDALIAGRDMRTEMDAIRKDIGICLQHDCLFPMLTVREHLQFFARIKGLYDDKSTEAANASIGQVIRDVALGEKQNTYSKNLSGGMKRKLSVAIAFCGGSKVVLLDEPTSGMDPFSRRFTWNVIRQYRQDRCIILTTHFMDEADILGDRIAIMADGQLRCIGSSLFLKKTYGVGYQLTIEKYTGGQQKSCAGNIGHDNGHETKAYTNIDEELHNIVESAVPDASLLSKAGSEMTFQLPMGAASNFGIMFEGLDKKMETKAVSSYGVGVTTLDEVFLLVARGQSSDTTSAVGSFRQAEDAAGITTTTSEGAKSARSRMDLEKQQLFRTHCAVLFWKRAAIFRRDKKAWVCTTILPSVFVLIGFLVFAFAAPQRDLDPLLLTLNDYNPNIDGGPRNPIVVNEAGGASYRCQPSICAYDPSNVTVPSTGEEYFFCARQVSLDPANYTNATECSIAESQEIVARLDGIAGATAVPVEVGNVLQSSLALSNVSKEFPATQYGALFYSHDASSTISSGTSYDQTVQQLCSAAGGDYTASQNCSRFTGYGYVIQYNFTAVHASPLFQTLADEAMVRQALDTENFNMQATIYPLPITSLEDNYGAAEDVFFAWFLVVLSFPFIAGSFATFVVSERASKAKHLQTVAGVEPSAYWISTFLWDCANYVLPAAIVIALMFIFNVDVMTTTDRSALSGVIMVIILYGPAAAGFSYCVSFAFESPNLCNLFLIVFGFLIGLGGPIAALELTASGSDPINPKESLVIAANVITWILRPFPSFCLGQAIYSIINVEFIEYLEGQKVDAWEEAVLLVEVISLVVQTVAYLSLAIQLDRWSSNPAVMHTWQKVTRILTCNWLCVDRGKDFTDMTTALPDDDDVVAEQDRVLKGEANSDLIVISQLTKMYHDGKIAVNNMSLGIPPGECFGLLGINGAGKTTTMSMLTAEFSPTSGDATLGGFSVSREPHKTRRRIGYCPQFDAHFANLTGREHVELYAAIKGIPKESVKEAAMAKLREVGLSEADADRLSAVYSGGMKRRLSLACAMVGQPQIVFLDECSTGVDPVARREIWRLISDMVSGIDLAEQDKTSVILTTHSIEECEALCPRIGIMANGRLRCLGSAQHLKNKFGQGFQVELKTRLVDKEDEDYLECKKVLAENKPTGSAIDVDAGNEGEMFFTMDETRAALVALTGDDYLADMVNASDPSGYLVYKNATAGLEPLDELAAFATTELRMRNLERFVRESFGENSALRERQDTKARYEVNSDRVKIADIFAAVEDQKESLRLADYGVSQTSLEQVFNVHAAQAEELKAGRVPWW